MKIHANFRMKLLNFLKLNAINHFFLISLSVFFTLANLTHGFIGSFSRYGADDYCTAGKLNSLGFWNAQSFWYNNWTGRFSFTFFVSIFELFEPIITSVLPYLFIICLYFSIYVFLIAALKKIIVEKSGLFSVLLTSISVFMILFTVPNIRQNLYWMTGSTTYFLPIIMIFLFLSFLITQYDKRQKNKISNLIINLGVFLFGFILSGFSEVLSVIQVLIFGLAIVFILFSKKRIELNLSLFIALLGSISGLMVMVIAPGNSVRLSQHLPSPDLFGLVFNSLVLSLKFTFLWFVKHINIIWPTCTMIIVFSLFLKVRTEVIEYLKKNKLTIFGFFIVPCLALVYVSYLPSIWATAKPPVERVLIFPAVILTIMCVFLSLTVGIILKDLINQSRIPQNKLITIIYTVACLYFLLGVPFYQARINYANRAEARTFATRWDERETIIHEQLNNGESVLVVPMIPENILDVEHLQNDPSHWINVCAAEYYGVEQISSE